MLFVDLAEKLYLYGSFIYHYIAQIHTYIYAMQVAAIFKILRSTPPIPETLSLEGKDFLRCCFERNPAERPPAAMLLELPFVNNVTDVVSL